jgi:phosphoribosylpyrophosphate synthetase
VYCPSWNVTVITDTVAVKEPAGRPALLVLSVGPVIGEAIHRNYYHRSIGNLFDYGEEEA